MKFPTFKSALFAFLVCLFFFDASAQTRGWGSNHTGQLGIGSSGNYQPNAHIITTVPDATAVEASDYHTIFLKADGTLAASGYGGNIGDGTTIWRPTPVAVLNLTNVTAVSAGVFHSLAVKSDGTVWAWGSNGHGALGDGSQLFQAAPVQTGATVPGFNNIVAVAAGFSFSYALKADGTVWAWGDNARGQLGNGTSGGERILPAQISTLSNVIAIQAGDAHGVALKSDGTVWAWGWNAQGEIGNGTTGWSGSGGQQSCLCYPTPTASLISGVSQIAAGGHNNAALKSDGTVWVWGRDNPHYPFIRAISNVIEIDAGYDVTYARKRDGSVWAWGRNEVGQLGIGTFQTVPYYSPFQTNVGTNNAFVGSGYHHAYTGIPLIATPAGSSVRHYGENVNITFASVSAAGTTQYGSFDPATFAPIAGFDIVDNSRAYHLTTTAAFTSATVCLNVPTTYSETKFNTLSILHQENGIFVDRTVSRNYQRREICAAVTSFSRFVLALPARATTAFDFDGDGKSDISLFRPADGDWHLLRSATQDWTPVHFGASGDKLAPADFDGDGRTDIAVFRDGVWYWLNSSNNSFSALQFGIGSDIPVPADYTGDGRAELAVYRAGFWYLLDLESNHFHSIKFGISTDRTVPADYDADGKTDLAVYRDGYWYIQGSSQGFYSIYFGNSTDKPVVGDYDGDGRADAALYRADAWHILGSTAGYYATQFGIATDIPAPADYDGDGKTDLAVFRDGIWYLLRSAAGFTGVQFGVVGDKPVPAAFVP